VNGQTDGRDFAILRSLLSLHQRMHGQNRQMQNSIKDMFAAGISEKQGSIISTT
jgi:hypothetical protein